MSVTTELWNSLEIAKIIIGVISSIIILIIGFLINKKLKNIDNSLWMNQKIIEKRLLIFDEMAYDLNILFCYFTYIGLWKNYSPDQIIKLKRKLDQIAYVNYPLFSPGFLENYNSLINLCFETYTGWGGNAKLRTKYARRKDAFGIEWCELWRNNFSRKKTPKREEVKKEYLKLMIFFSSELGIVINIEK